MNDVGQSLQTALVCHLMVSLLTVCFIPRVPDTTSLKTFNRVDQKM